MKYKTELKQVSVPKIESYSNEVARWIKLLPNNLSKMVDERTATLKTWMYLHLVKGYSQSMSAKMIGVEESKTYLKIQSILRGDNLKVFHAVREWEKNKSTEEKLYEELHWEAHDKGNLNLKRQCLTDIMKLRSLKDTAQDKTQSPDVQVEF